VTCQFTLLAACAVIAASLIGGCSLNAVNNTAGPVAKAPAPTATVAREPLAAPANPAPVPAKPAPANPAPVPAKPAPAPVVANRELDQQLASVALDDAKLSDIRGGYDTSSGVTLNFAFQQATFVNHNLTENIVVPTLTIAPGQGTSSASGAMAGAAARPNVSVGSLVGLGIAGASPGVGNAGGISSATVVANGSVQTQVSVSSQALQALVSSGLATVVGPTGAGANNGITTTVANTASNQLIQQLTTVDIGVSGLSKLMQQSVASTVMNRLAGPNGFR
jgi:hypothetical protein